MPHAHRHFHMTKAGRFLALTTAATLSLGFLSTGAALAAPAPGPTVLNSATTTAVASTLNVRAQTGEWALALGSIDPSRNRLYLAVASEVPKVAQVDLSTGAATLIPLGAAGAYAAIDTAVSPVDGTVYVAHNSYDPGISVIDPSQIGAGAPLPPVITTGLEDNPQQLDVGNDGRVYALHLGQRTVSVIGASDGPDRLNVVQTLTGLESREGNMAIDNDRDRLYVVSPVSKTLTVIDTQAVPAVVLGVITLAASPVGVGVNAATGQVLITSIVDNSVSWLTVADDQESAIVTRTEPLAPLPVGASSASQPASISVRADGTTFVVTTVYPSRIRSQVTVIPPVVSAATPISLATVGFGANGGVFDPRAGGTLYVPNGSQGTLSEISDVTLSTYATSTSIGSPGTLRATVSRSDARAFTGTVSFTDSSAQPLGTAPVDASGTAELAVSNPPLGSLGFTAAVATPQEIPLSAAGTLTVSKAASTTTLTTSTVVEGTSASATIEVTGLTGVAATGGYTVTTAAGLVLASGTLTDGRATASFTAPPAGTTSVIAHFAGDSTLLASDSAAVDLVVTARTPAVTAPATQGTVGGKASVSVSGFAPGENVSVTLHSDPIFLGTVKTDSVGSGTLTFVVPVVAPGLHHIVAVGETSGRVTTLPFTVAATGTTTPGTTTPGTGTGGTALASTGTNPAASLWLVALLVLLGAGACAVAGTRRARRVH
ncbi:hypothetical protein AB4Y63_06080 [Leifsonia sp. YAF41]|uniref:hypothetical protein n=1 Tax=Leifsonia sp. YAF41 TaxID=3233086 RepID=UPI003F99DACC